MSQKLKNLLPRPLGLIAGHQIIDTNESCRTECTGFEEQQQSNAMQETLIYKSSAPGRPL